MTDLRTRIAAVLKDARIVTYWRDGVDEADGQPYRSLVIRSDEQAAEYAADAVIRELGREWRIDIGYGGYEYTDTREEADERLAEIYEDWGDDPPDTGAAIQSRYVTEWEPDDE